MARLPKEPHGARLEQHEAEFAIAFAWFEGDMLDFWSIRSDADEAGTLSEVRAALESGRDDAP